MVALAGIGKMPDTIEDRAVVVQMRRRTSDEQVRPYRERRDGHVLQQMHERLSKWVGQVLTDLLQAEPDMPVEDRAADTWEPLVAVADQAGGSWPARARAVCLAMTAAADGEAAEASWGVRLLSDIRHVITGPISSADLVEALRKMDEAPWGAFELNQRDLARRLAPYGIKPRQLPRARADRQARGYTPELFTDSWARYLPSKSDSSDGLNETSVEESPSTVAPSPHGQVARPELFSCVTTLGRATSETVTPVSTVAQNEPDGLRDRALGDGVTDASLPSDHQPCDRNEDGGGA
jgi:hypothetical protein